MTDNDPEKIRLITDAILRFTCALKEYQRIFLVMHKQSLEVSENDNLNYAQGGRLYLEDMGTVADYIEDLSLLTIEQLSERLAQCETKEQYEKCVKILTEIKLRNENIRNNI